MAYPTMCRQSPKVSTEIFLQNRSIRGCRNWRLINHLPETKSRRQCFFPLLYQIELTDAYASGWDLNP